MRNQKIDMAFVRAKATPKKTSEEIPFIKSKPTSQSGFHQQPGGHQGVRPTEARHEHPFDELEDVSSFILRRADSAQASDEPFPAVLIELCAELPGLQRRLCGCVSMIYTTARAAGCPPFIHSATYVAHDALSRCIETVWIGVFERTGDVRIDLGRDALRARTALDLLFPMRSLFDADIAEQAATLKPPTASPSIRAKSGPTSPPSEPRIEVKPEQLLCTINGTEHPLKNERQATILKAIVDADARWVPRDKIPNYIKGERLDRILDVGLPKPIDRLIERKSGRDGGRRLRPDWRSLLDLQAGVPQSAAKRPDKSTKRRR